MSFLDDDFEIVAEPERPTRLGRVSAHEETESDAVLVSNLTQLQKTAEMTLGNLRQEFERIASEREEIEHLKSEMVTRIAQYDRLAEQQRASIADAVAQSERLSERDDTVVGEIPVSDNSLQGSQARLFWSLSSELEILRKNRLELENDRALISSANSKVERQLDLLKQNRSQLEDRLDELGEIRDARNRTTNLIDKLQVLERFLGESEKEVDRLRSVRQQIETQVSQANAEIAAATSLQVGSKVRPGALRLLDESVAYTCKSCGTHIALESDIESKCYQVGQGDFSEKKRGYLFADACNLKEAKPKTETFTTGSYKISWVSCVKCESEMGWKYLWSDNSANSSKIGKYCLARAEMLSPADRHE